MDIPNATISCRLCAFPVQTKQWQGAECDHCGSVSSHRLPTEAELARFYNQYNRLYQGGGSSEGKNLQRYSNRYLEIVQRYAKQGHLLDIGSSNNPFPNDAKSAGFEVTSVDYVKPAALLSGVQFVEGNVSNEEILAKLSHEFDVVTSWAVIEHLPDPRVSAMIIARLCKPQGLIFLSTPEIGTGLTNYSIGRSGWFYPPEHINLVSPRAIEILFAPYGCRLISCGRLELSPLRFVVRYGIGAIEATVGFFLKTLAPKKWQALRDTKVHKFAGITYFVLQKEMA
jgi:SAM-dependent methyltransferase